MIDKNTANVFDCGVFAFYPKKVLIYPKIRTIIKYML